MFFVQVTNEVDYQAAMKLIHEYYTGYGVVKENGITTITVSGGDDLCLCEMAFQMNFSQTGKMCHKCSDAGELSCGHLTFTELL